MSGKIKGAAIAAAIGLVVGGGMALLLAGAVLGFLVGIGAAILLASFVFLRGSSDEKRDRLEAPEI